MPGERTDIDIGESLHGGGRFNVLLIILGAMVAMVVGMVVVHSLFARSTVAPIASESAEEDDLARDKARIEELASYAKPSASTISNIASSARFGVIRASITRSTAPHWAARICSPRRSLLATPKCCSTRPREIMSTIRAVLRSPRGN